MLLYMRADTPYKTLDDVRNAKEPPKCGTTGISNSAYVVPKLFEETIGAKFEVVLRLQGRRCCRLGGRQGGTPRFIRGALLLARAFHTGARTDSREYSCKGEKIGTKSFPMCQRSMKFWKKYKAPESGRRLVTAMLAAEEFFWPHYGPPGIPPGTRENPPRSVHEDHARPRVFDRSQKEKIRDQPDSGEEMDALIKQSDGPAHLRSSHR